MGARAIPVTKQAGDLANSAWITALAMVFGLAWSAIIGFMIYIAIRSSAWSFETLEADLQNFYLDGDLRPLIVFLVIEQVLNVLEFIARKRSHMRGFTLPLTFLPFGRTLRWVIIEVCSLFVLIPKMGLYLLYVAIAPIFDALFGRFVSIGKVMDVFDQVFEFFEKILRLIYNVLYYTKVETGADGLTIWFNRILSLWCVHHSNN